MKKLSEFTDYCGTDASNEISLYEYGMLLKEGESEIDVIIGVGFDDDGNYNLFEFFTVTPNELNEIIDESWFNKEAFFSFADFNDGSYAEAWAGHKLSALISYYGFENILGAACDPFEIENDDN